MRRSRRNPILTRRDLPGIPGVLRDASSVFNPGAVRWKGRDLLFLRVQTRGRETLWMPAWSHDGERFDVEPSAIEIQGLADAPEPVHHAYDPRITVLRGPVGDELVVAFAVDTDDACRVAIARGPDLRELRLVSFDTTRDSRNAVVFPTRIGGLFVRFERPNVATRPDGPPTGSTIHIATSPDLVTWALLGPVFTGRPRRWDELIGSGPPPVLTHRGWLHLYHGVATHFGAANVYQAGVALLDADAPARVLARSRDNVLEPRELYELTGQVPNVVFPSGWIVDGAEHGEPVGDDAAIRIYYGAADTCVGLAHTTVGELLAACEEA